jgi:hypothetical protein
VQNANDGGFWVHVATYGVTKRQVNLLVVPAFETLRVPYFLGGSMASSVHGIYLAGTW